LVVCGRMEEQKPHVVRTTSSVPTVTPTRGGSSSQEDVEISLSMRTYTAEELAQQRYEKAMREGTVEDLTQETPTTPVRAAHHHPAATRRHAPTTPRHHTPHREVTPGEYVCTFGQHSGESVRDIPASYVTWCRNQKRRNGGEDQMSELIRAYDSYHGIEAPREFVCTFGQYANVPLSRVPASYVRWCERQHTPSPAMKELVQAYRRQRRRRRR